MFIDASALVAILGKEEDSEVLALRLGKASEKYVSPLSIWEATHGLHRSTEMSLEQAEAVVRGLVDTMKAEIVAIDDAIGREATRASRLFGRGRHKAASISAIASPTHVRKSWAFPFSRRATISRRPT